MKTLRICLLVFALAWINTAMAQEQKKKVTYEFTVYGLKSAADASKLDSIMLTKKGIHKSKSDVLNKKIKVTVDDGVDFNALKNVVLYAGFEASEMNLVRKEESATE
ncbi:MAG: heavy metal-associated domain-containing protein [Bacteroidota bacterium]